MFFVNFLLSSYHSLPVHSPWVIRHPSCACFATPHMAEVDRTQTISDESVVFLCLTCRTPFFPRSQNRFNTPSKLWNTSNHRQQPTTTDNNQLPPTSLPGDWRLIAPQFDNLRLYSKSISSSIESWPCALVINQIPHTLWPADLDAPRTGLRWAKQRMWSEYALCRRCSETFRTPHFCL